VSETEEGIHM